jgi:aspartyl-tRNA(Asn)/glutamyl-tRNA(Gln) amidotransferase subunit C
MITLDEMKNLAMLARIGMSDDELLAMAHEFDSILGYVDQINNVQVSDIADEQLQKNITHSDSDAYASGTYSEKMIAGAPDSLDGFYKVPKIL